MIAVILVMYRIPGFSITHANGGFVLPCWCDSHTHLVFAASREEEFVVKIRGLTYSQIAEKGGGILNSARKLNQASEDELFAPLLEKANGNQEYGYGCR
jgi:imidazolonepropionase